MLDGTSGGGVEIGVTEGEVLQWYERRMLRYEMKGLMKG